MLNVLMLSAYFLVRPKDSTPDSLIEASFISLAPIIEGRRFQIDDVHVRHLKIDHQPQISGQPPSSLDAVWVHNKVAIIEPCHWLNKTLLHTHSQCTLQSCMDTLSSAKTQNEVRIT